MRPRWLTRSWWRSWVSPPDVRNSAGFLEAERWAIGYAPAGQDEAYAPAREFAQKQFDLIVGLSETLDKKADDWARFATTITGAIVTASSSKLITIRNTPLFVAALLIILVSVAAAVRARAPIAIITPMTARDLLKVADLPEAPSKGQIESVAAVSYHLAVEGIKSINVWKSQLINISTFIFGVGFVLLLAALGFG